MIDPIEAYKNQKLLDLRLDEAVSAGDLVAARSALVEGASQERGFDETPRKIALRQGNARMCRLLKQYGAEFAVATDLKAAIEKENRELCKFLIAECTPWEGLTMAGEQYSWGNFYAYYGEKWVFEMALEAAPDSRRFLTHPNAQWRSPLEQAAIYGTADLCRFMIEKGALINADAFVAAVNRGGSKRIQVFLDGGACPNSVETSESSVLQKAAKKGDTEVVAMLLDAGASIDFSPNGSNALLWGACHPDVVKLLRARGADMRAVNTDGLNVLMVSAQSSIDSFDSFLSVAKVVEDIPELFVGKSYDGRSLLHIIAKPKVFARQEDVEKAIRLVVSRGLSSLIDEPDGRGNTPLMAAASSEWMIKAFLANGSNVHAKNFIGHTALSMAASAGGWDKSKFLLAAGANINQPGPGGYTPLDLAIRYERDHLYPLYIAEGAECGVIDLNMLRGNKKFPAVLFDCPLVAAIKTEDFDYFKNHLERHPETSHVDKKAAQTFFRRRKKAGLEEFSAYFNSWLAQRAIDDVMEKFRSPKRLPDC